MFRRPRVEAAGLTSCHNRGLISLPRLVAAGMGLPWEVGKHSVRAVVICSTLYELTIRAGTMLYNQLMHRL